MATSIALALATAAITACGGGGGDSQGSSSTGSSVSAPGANAAGSTNTADGAASAVEVVTTNQGAITATSDDASSTDTTTNAGTGTSAAASAPTGSSTVASTDANDTTTKTDDPPSDADPAASSGASTTSASRPAGNTGTGFYVAGGKLYDSKGKEFRIRGVNRTHYDSPGSPIGLPRSGANTERISLSYSKDTSFNMGIVNNEMLANKIVPMPSNWSATCKSDAASLTAIVDIWVAQAATWTKLNSNGLINIANEWGPANSTVWRDNYITAIARMRAAGYTGTLVVDSGGCAQDAADVVKYGADVLASDPQKNILFDVHVYGGFSYPATVSWQQDYAKSMAALKATGLPILLGEFGPGRKVGPSPTMITPETIIATAEANGWGWMPWAWDDNNLAACAADDNWFSMTTKCGSYTGLDSELTTFGKTVVPLLKQLATKASSFN